MARALVAFGVGAPLEVVEVEPPPLGPGDVRIAIAAAGICHSDLSMTNGTIPSEFPVVLGHEAAGVLAEVGGEVSELHAGQHVVLNWAPPCRECAFCSRGEPWLCTRNAGVACADRGARLGGAPLFATLGVGAFCEEIVLPASHVVAVPDDLPLETAALLGCAVLTGTGAVRRTARVRAGESVAVIGLGGVGLSVLAGARLAGATTVLGIDRSSDKEALALAEGASEFLLASDELVREVRARTGGLGADHVFDCVASAATIRSAWQATRRGGTTVVVGVGPRSDEVRFNALELFHYARTLTSSVFGSSDPERDLPELVAAVTGGDLDPARLATHRCGLEGVAEAFARMENGVGGRTLITF
jgi:S-(hydroxymethyl)glutathione dehydrogenase / alcohol dehydrogenase